MNLTGRVWKTSGSWWGAEAPIAGLQTQGKSRDDAKAMLADALVGLVNRPGFRVTVTDLDDADTVLVETNEPAALVAYVLKRQRVEHGLSLADVTAKLGAKSRNAYARYEQGTSVPTVDKLAELLHAVAPEIALVFIDRNGKPTKRRAGPTTTPRRRTT